jgi:hypothetical protein
VCCCWLLRQSLHLRAQGEADFLTSRAQKLAPESDEVNRLRAEVVKLLELKTNRRGTDSELAVKVELDRW